MTLLVFFWFYSFYKKRSYKYYLGGRKEGRYRRRKERERKQAVTEKKVTHKTGACPREPQTPTTTTLELWGQSEKHSDQVRKNKASKDMFMKMKLICSES